MILLLDQARRKLFKECSRPIPELRQLVGHANLVDDLVYSIRDHCTSQFRKMDLSGLSTTTSEHLPKTQSQILAGSHNCYCPDDTATPSHNSDENVPVETMACNGYNY